MIIIGIDPGTKILGFSVLKFDIESQDLEILSSGILKFDNKKKLSEKLKFTYDTFLNFINKYKKIEKNILLCVEKQYIDKNPHSAFCLISSRTIFMLLSEQLSCEYIEIEPSVIKKVLTGNGNASKEEIMNSINFYFQDLKINSYDEADAISCAISGLMNYKEKIIYN